MDFLCAEEYFFVPPTTITSVVDGFILSARRQSAWPAFAASMPTNKVSDKGRREAKQQQILQILFICANVIDQLAGREFNQVVQKDRLQWTTKYYLLAQVVQSSFQWKR